VCVCVCVCFNVRSSSVQMNLQHHAKIDDLLSSQEH